MCNRTLSTLLALLITPLAVNGAVEVSGVIESISHETLRATVKVKEEPIVVRLGRGDSAYLEAGDRIRGRLVEEPEGLRMEMIWPDDPKTGAMMTAVNNQLRRDTEVRGRKVFRSIGEDLPPFALYNQYGEVVRAQDLEGKTSVINFIFTRCTNPRMCPAATSRMHQLQIQVKEAGLENVQFVSMTLDPDYDTPGVFNAYASRYGIDGSNFHFLGGPKQALVDLKEQLGIITQKDPRLIINHTMRTILVDATGTIVYQVPGSQWSVDDFLNRVEELNTKMLTSHQ